MNEQKKQKIIGLTISVFLIISGIFLICMSLALQNSIERCEAICELNNEATQSLDMCVGLVNDLGDANISSNFTRLNCKTICGG